MVAGCRRVVAVCPSVYGKVLGDDKYSWTFRTVHFCILCYNVLSSVTGLTDETSQRQ